MLLDRICPTPAVVAAMRAGLGGFIGVCLIGCGGVKEAPEPPRQPPDLILISIDSLRPDHLGSYGYPRNTSPFLDRLAAEGIRFENAVSTTSWTLPSHAAMLTGLYDSTHGLVDNGLTLNDGHVTLAEVLGAVGYETVGFFGGPYLHPVFGMGQGFDSYASCMTTTPDEAAGEEVRREARQRRGNSHRDITGPRTLEAVRSWADSRQSDRPFFLFVHLWDVHYDFMPPPPYDTMFDPAYEGSISGRLMSDPNIRPGMPARDLEHVLALYDGEIRFTDEIVATMLGHLRKRGLLEDTMVVVTADHGEEFFEHRDKGHHKHLFDEVLKVPLVIWWPSVLPGNQVVTDQVRLVDLMPTFVEITRASPLPLAGRSLWPLLRGEELAPAPALAELMIDGQSQRALRTNDRKIYRPADDEGAFLLRLDDDPTESRPISPGTTRFESQRRQGAKELLTTFQRALALKRALGEREADSLELNDEMRARLRSLGYLTDSDG